jgi:hypothetical protein
MQPISATGTLFRDEFTADGPLNAANWNFPTGDPSFLGATQIRPSLPQASGGSAILQLDTFNPSGNPSSPTYFGSAAFTNQSFGFVSSNSPGGIAFETRARLSPTDANGNPANPSGLIAGFFPFVALPGNTHDEIDFEWIPTRSANSANPNLTQTNAYQNDPYDGGIFQTAPIPGGGTLMEYHVYRIEWLPHEVRWFVDGVNIRVEGTVVPTHDMQLWMNIWGPPSAWDVADWTNLPAVGSAAQNQTRLFELDYVSVESLSASVGSRAPERLLGTALNDHFRGLAGADEVLAGAGNDFIHGGGAADTLHGGEGSDTIRGGSGNDLIVGDAGADWLQGGEGDDTLIGGAGADRLKGGTGADHFRMLDVADSPWRDGDTIVDFDAAEGDRIDLSAIDTDPVAPGDQDFAFIGTAAFSGSAAAPGVAELRYMARDNGVVVLADVNGDGRADMEIRVAGVASLQESDFLL